MSGINIISPDERLIQECLAGNDQAWAALIDKYRKLIYSIPIKYGFSRDEADEIFQEVCLTLLSQLPQLREPRSLVAWLIKVTSHQCFHWHKKMRPQNMLQPAEYFDSLPAESPVPGDIAVEAQREQALRNAVADQNGRCRELIEMLFFSTPSVPYEQVAQTLGLATGSIGFIRMRCLKRLRRRLEELGFR